MNYINQINKNTFLLLLVGALLLMVTTSSVYAIWPQIKEIRTGLDTRNELRGLVTNKDQLEEQYAKLAQEVKAMKRNLKGDMANLPEKKMEAYIIGELQNISWNHEVSLIAIKPAKGNEIQMFQEILFNIQLSGEYFDLYNWLLDLRDQLGFIVIKSIELNISNTNNTTLLMKLTIASYKSL